MLKIGYFSRLSQTPVRTLHYYDQIGLFRPAHVDADSGYRYYTLDQLPRLHRILALKELGLSLEQIEQMLKGRLSTDQVCEMLRLREAQLENQLREARAELARVQARLRQIEMEDKMPDYEVVLKTVEPIQVAAKRVFIPTNDQVPSILGPAFGDVYDYVYKQGVSITGPGIAVWYSPADVFTNEEVEAAVPIGEQLPAHDGIRTQTLPEVKVAAAVHHGDFAEFGRAVEALLRWIEENGYAIIGPYREVYLKFDPHDTTDTTTEVQFPVEKA